MLFFRVYNDFSTGKHGVNDSDADSELGERFRPFFPQVETNELFVESRRGRSSPRDR